jgi:hypothetical protein
MVLACTWAARHDRLSRSVLGFVLLIPGVVSGFYALAAVLSYVGGEALPGTPGSLSHPATLREALSPMVLLPLAIVGAWLLSRGEVKATGAQ